VVRSDLSHHGWLLIGQPANDRFAHLPLAHSQSLQHPPAGRLRRPQEAEQQVLGPDHVLVISCGSKGVAMRPDSLRAATAQAAARSTNKLSTRL